MRDDAALIEDCLLAIAESGIDIRHDLFDRFFATYPERRDIFYNLEVSSVRMTDETLQMMLGLARGEKWVWPLVAELTFTHRNYGALPVQEWEGFLDITLEALANAAGPAWTEACASAWERQALALKVLLAESVEGWKIAMPGGISEKV